MFSLNAGLDNNVNNFDSFTYPGIRSKYFSPHSFEEGKNNLTKNDICFSIFHNNVRSLNFNLEDLKSRLLEELDFHFDLIGVTETRITNTNCGCSRPFLVIILNTFPHPSLSAGGVGMFIDESQDYVILEKTSTTAFRALWIEICYTGKKIIECGIIYRQHNFLEQLQHCFEDAIEKFISSGKPCVSWEIRIKIC